MEHYFCVRGTPPRDFTPERCLLLTLLCIAAIRCPDLCAPFCCERLLDDGDHGIADVNKVNLFETSAAPSLIVKLLNCRQVTLCTDLLGHSENSC